MTARTRFPSRMALLAFLLLIAGGLVWGLAGAFASSSPPAAKKVILRVGWNVEPDNLNPYVGYETSSYELYHLNYDFLVGYDAKHLNPTPELAVSWTKSADGLVWTFKTRTGVKWQDGQPFTAADVAFTYNYIIKNDLYNYTGAMRNIKSVTAPDATTVVITCSRPKADILAMWVPIVPEHIWSKLNTSDKVNAYLNGPPMIGTGAFQVVEWKHGKFVRAVANKSYWKGAPKIDEVVFQNYTNLTTMADDIKAGTIDVAEDLLPADLTSMKNVPGVSAGARSIKAFDYLSFNCYKGPSLGNPVLRNTNFRQALQWAVDRSKLVTVAYNGDADPGVSIFQPNFYDASFDWYYDPPTGQKYTFDLAKANQLLDAGGYKDTNGDGIREFQGKPIKLRLWARNESPTSQQCGKLIAGWFKQCGLDITLSSMDNSVLADGQLNYVGKTYKPNYDMYIWGWLPSGSDPIRALGYFTTDQIENQNDPCWSNAQYDKLFEQQATELDKTKRLQIVHQMEAIFYQESPYIVLAYPKQLEAIRTDKWTDWTPAPEKIGPVVFVGDNVDNYRTVTPRVATAAASGSSNTTLYVVIGALVVVAIAVVVWMVIRRPKVEER